MAFIAKAAQRSPHPAQEQKDNMTVTLKEMMASLSAKERQAVEARAADLRAEEMTVRDSRNALDDDKAKQARYPRRTS